MDLKEAVERIEKEVEQEINQNNTGEEVRFYIDRNRLANKLKSFFNEDLNNLKLSLGTIKNIVRQSISLVEYAKINNCSYSSIFQNKNRYVTLIETKRENNSTYTVSEMELSHSKRVENDWGGKVEHLVRNNKIASKGLVNLSNEMGIDIGSTVYRLIMERITK